MRGFKQISAAIFVAAFIVSPAAAEDVIRFKSTGDIRSLDPMENTSLFIRDMGYHIFDTLFSKDSKLQVQPQMVENYNVNGDFTNFSFTLRDGLKFTDGSAVKSADVIASIKRWASKDSMGAEILARLNSFSAVDDKTFEIKLNSPFPRLIEAFAKVSNYPLFIMPERIASKPVTERITEIVGSGPYKLVQNEWVPGVKLVLEKNNDYVPRKEPADGLAGGKIAYIERLERITVPDDTSAINALLAGELDYILEFPPQMLPILRADPDIKVGKLTDKTVVLVPNHTQPPFDNLKVRQALQYAFKQEDFLRTQMGDNKDYYKICPAIFQCGFPFETDKGSESFMNPDPVKATKMLADAGYDGSPVYYLHPMDGFTQRDMGTVAVNDLRRAGFKVEDVQTDNASFLTRRTNKQAPSAGGWSLLLTALPPDYAADPLVNLFTTGACDKAFVGWPCDEKLHDLWKKFLTATPEESKQLAEQMQARAYEIVTVIPMGQYWDLKAWRSEFSGFIDSPVAALWNVRRAK